ncbi:hypothetical protein [Paraburkholderia sp. ZP32-5]|uniref:hypothetical protein n=1 Tax=Paraburkholderia sp. ZP32-5 TaxID=2883245 RepID=UPI001F43B871|nr:hypothetical protein [Paraburkholderia sp. ZP32-5]
MNKQRFAGPVAIVVAVAVGKPRLDAECAPGKRESRDVTRESQGTALAVPVDIGVWTADARVGGLDVDRAVDCVETGSGSRLSLRH